ncbi:MAG TPA: FkbM family methyltransferase [Rhodothermales bacterium]
MSRIRQLVYLSEVVLQSGGLRALATWKPFSITAFRMLNALRASGLEFQTIIDGGANKGQFARAATEIYPNARIHAFEPLPDVAEALRGNLADRRQVTVHQTALGPTDGTITFYRQDYSLASSALRPTGPTRGTPIEVPVARLDSILHGEALARPVLLKLDLQGFEIEAMKGGPKVLEQSDYALLETAFVTGYEGEPGFNEVAAFMEGAGFEFVRPVDVLTERSGEIVQMDALFRKRTAPSLGAPADSR